MIFYRKKLEILAVWKRAKPAERKQIEEFIHANQMLIPNARFFLTELQVWYETQDRTLPAGAMKIVGGVCQNPEAGLHATELLTLLKLPPANIIPIKSGKPRLPEKTIIGGKAYKVRQ